ncbi:MAG TPA: DNA polymerase III subunit alpha, partial [Deinococcales bacterium]|nr:DNA polymerase III subunit alpha [Deinococcales bacterium]
ERPLSWYSPQYRSAGGIRALQFDKDDAEWLGLIKLDLLALRSLSALEEAVEEVWRMDGVRPDIWNLPEDDAVWELIRSGDTLSLFQIESPGQMQLSTVLQPGSMQELADQEALHRPGPIQSGSKRPYVQRKLGREPVTFPHRALEPILGKTYGVVIYQEQVVRIARHVAGMSWPEADRFRKKVQKADDDEAGQLRSSFIAGVLRTLPDATREQAAEIFGLCSAFTGFGFAESHSASFARITYATAWLLLHHPAEWFAAFFTVHPGMWPRQTLRMACRRRGIRVLGVDINVSGAAFRTERLPGGGKGIRMALTAVKGVTKGRARDIRWEGSLRPYRSAADFLNRVSVPEDTMESLVRAGAFAGVQERRQALHDVWALSGAVRAGQSPLFGPQLERPYLKPVSGRERHAWDVELAGMSSSPLHPLDYVRPELRELGVKPLGLVGSGPVRTAGLVVGVQKPPTAGGTAFVMLEDGEQLAQLIVSPELWQQGYRLLRDSRLLLVEGTARRAGLQLSISAAALRGFSSDCAVVHKCAPW